MPVAGVLPETSEGLSGTMSLWAAIIHALRRREPRPLTAVQRADGIELLVQASRKPVLRDDWPDGFDYVCGHCKKMVIASCVTEGQVWVAQHERARLARRTVWRRPARTGQNYGAG